MVTIEIVINSTGIMGVRVVGGNIIIIIITKEYDYGGVMSEDCKDTLQTK